MAQAGAAELALDGLGRDGRGHEPRERAQPQFRDREWRRVERLNRRVRAMDLPEVYQLMERVLDGASEATESTDDAVKVEERRMSPLQ